MLRYAFYVGLVRDFLSLRFFVLTLLFFFSPVCSFATIVGDSASVDKKSKTFVDHNSSSSKSKSAGVGKKSKRLLTRDEAMYLDYVILRRSQSDSSNQVFDPIVAQPSMVFSPEIGTIDSSSSVYASSDTRTLSPDVVNLFVGLSNGNLDTDVIVKSAVEKEAVETGVKMSSKEKKNRAKKIIPKTDSKDARADNKSKTYFAFGGSAIIYGSYLRTVFFQNPGPVAGSSPSTSRSPVSVFQSNTQFSPFLDVSIRVGRSIPTLGGLPYPKFWRVEGIFEYDRLQALPATATWLPETFTSSITGGPSLPANFGTANLFSFGVNLFLDLMKVRLHKLEFYPFLGVGVKFGIMHFDNYISTGPIAPIFDIYAGIIIANWKKVSLSISYKLTILYPTLYSVYGYTPGVPTGYAENLSADQTISYGVGLIHKIEFALYFF